MKKNSLFFTFLLFFCISLHADVFTLGPFRGGKSWGADILGGTKLWTEKMKVNGIETGMRLTLLDQDLDECFRILRNQFPQAQFLANEESIFVEITRKKGFLERLYLVNIGGVYPVMQFSIQIPKKMPKKPEWPEPLPLPPASFPKQVIELPERGTIYGSFVSSLTPKQAMNDADSTMISKGWSSFGQGVYLKDKPMRIVVFTATEDENGKTHGSVIHRKLKTK